MIQQLRKSNFFTKEHFSQLEMSFLAHISAGYSVIFLPAIVIAKIWHHHKLSKHIQIEKCVWLALISRLVLFQMQERAACIQTQPKLAWPQNIIRTVNKSEWFQSYLKLHFFQREMDTKPEGCYVTKRVPAGSQPKMMWPPGHTDAPQNIWTTLFRVKLRKSRNSDLGFRQHPPEVNK